MITGKWIAMSAVAVLMSSVLFADDTAMPPATDTPAPVHHRSKLIKPYSELTGLTDDQKTKIIAAHAEYLKAEKELLAKEKAEIETFLTDDQKAQLETLESKGKSSKKSMKESGGEATTQPAS